MAHAEASCEIYSVARRNSFHWKWRRSVGGSSLDCAEEYALFFDCVRAARASGYEPRANWTRALLVTCDSR